MTEKAVDTDTRGIRFAFPPLIIILQHHQAWLRDTANALLSGTPLPPRVQLPVEQIGSGRELAQALSDVSLRKSWDEAERLLEQFAELSRECVEAAQRGDGKGAAGILDQMFGVESAMIELLSAASIGEIVQLFTAREQQLALRYEQSFLEAAHIGRFTVRMSDQALASCDDSFAALFDSTAARMRHRDVRVLIGDDAWTRLTADLRSGETRRVDVRGIGAKAQTVQIVAYVTTGGTRSTLHGFVVNRSQAEADAEQRRLLYSAVEASDQAVIIADADGKIVYVNGAFVRMTGYGIAEALGRTPAFLQGKDTDMATLAAIREAMEAGRPCSVELLNYRRSGEAYWIDMSIVPVPDASGSVTHWVSIQRDVTSRRTQEAEITRLAMEDHLTGLPNRRAAETRLATEWSRARRQKGSFAIAIADVDRFKQVNDQYGHQVGDAALTHMAKLLTQSKRGGDWIARWGGEEFLICLHDLDAHGAYVAGERLRRRVKSVPLKIPQGELTITVSLGVAMYADDCEDLEALIRRADALLYEAKSSGRDKTLCSDSVTLAQWQAGQVQSAIQEKRVVAAFQPIVDLRSGETVGEEALARIVGQNDELVPAQQFIATAEALRLISAIDDTVSAAALRRGARVREQGRPSFTHFINLSPQFISDAAQVNALLERAQGLNVLNKTVPHAFVIELAEREMGEIKMLQKRLRPLLEAGFSLALDDFGSGRASFAYLADLPLSFLKIEGWMVQRLVRDPRVRQLVAGIVGTAKNFSARTVAECVEDGETAQVLCDLGVDWAQGYFFAAPGVAH